MDMPISSFTYAGYRELFAIVRYHGYVICNYHNYANTVAPCIIRHDIDFDVEKALRLAELEAAAEVKSTYFVLLNTNFYNICASGTQKMLKGILALGHEIGLHYDEAQFDMPNAASSYYIDSIVENIQKEIRLLEQIIERPVLSVSMHRPSQFILDANISIPGVVNSYGKEFLYDFKYMSDSRHYWRENAEEVIQSGRYKKLHILTHPFWYTETSKTCREELHRFIAGANLQRYRDLSGNFKNIEEFIKWAEV
jgi:hypothetical protein